MRVSMNDDSRIYEDRLHSILKGIEEVYIESDLKGKITFFNDAACEKLGYSPEELAGMSYRDLSNQEMADRIYRLFNNVYRTGKPLVASEFEIITKQGEPRLMEVFVYPVLDPKGSVSGFRCFARDITDLKNAEMALKIAAAKWSATFDAVPDAICILDTEQRIQLSNKGMSRLFNKEVADMIGRRCYEVVHGRSKPIPDCPFLRMKKSLTRESLIWSVDQRWFEVTVDPMFNQEGSLTGGVHVAREITARKQMEDKLKSSEERYRTIIETIEDGYYETDLRGRVIFLNNSLGRMLRCPMEDIIGKDGRQFLDEENYKRVVDFFTNIYNTGKADTGFICEVIRKDGTRMPIEASVALIRDPRGKPKGFRGIVRDITDRELAKELERQLMRAQKMEAIGTLAGGIAHDFNNILTVILGNISLLKAYHAKPGDKIHSRLTETEKATLKARDLVRRILSFSKQELEQRAPTSFGPLVEETLKMLMPAIPSTIELSQDIDKDAGLVMGNVSQIEQVIMNLCTNAVHAMRENGGVLKIKVKKAELSDEFFTRNIEIPPGEYLELTISDTGHGIEPEIMDKIFDPYFTTKQVGEGSGLGLAMAQGIVKKHGGLITVDSIPGKGTTFHVYLPIFSTA